MYLWPVALRRWYINKSCQINFLWSNNDASMVSELIYRWNQAKKILYLRKRKFRLHPCLWQKLKGLTFNWASLYMFIVHCVVLTVFDWTGPVCRYSSSPVIWLSLCMVVMSDTLVAAGVVAEQFAMNSNSHCVTFVWFVYIILSRLDYFISKLVDYFIYNICCTNDASVLCEFRLVEFEFLHCDVLLI